MQASLRLAGNIVIDYLSDNTDLLVKNIGYFSPRLSSFKPSFTKLIGYMPECTIANILYNDGKRFSQQIALHGVPGGGFIKLQELLKFGYSSLFYYAGLMLRSSIGTDNESLKDVTIHKAGNGWAHISWIIGPDDLSKPLNVIFSRCFQKGFGKAIKLDLSDSKEHKLEVAKGLLTDINVVDLEENPGIETKTSDLVLDINCRKAILGENGFYIEGKNKNWNDRFDNVFSKTKIRKDQIYDKIPNEFQMYDDFVNSYLGGVKDDLKLVDSLNYPNVQHRIRARNLEITEPPFFTVVKTTIKRVWGIELP